MSLELPHDACGLHKSQMESNMKILKGIWPKHLPVDAATAKVVFLPLGTG